MIRQPASSPNTCSASAAAADDTDAGLSPIAVCARTLRPAWRAWRKTLSSTRPGGPAPEAAGLSRRVGGADLPENLAFAGDERAQPGRDAKQVQRSRLVAQAIERRLDLR